MCHSERSEESRKQCKDETQKPGLFATAAFALSDNKPSAHNRRWRLDGLAAG